jgi:hypothetical protein
MAKDFIGGADAHLAMMEHLATATEGGESGTLFTAYVENQRAAAAQVEAGNLFAEKGKTSVAAANSAEAQLEAKAKELMAKDSKLTMEQAMSQAADAHPELYSQYVKEQSAG